MSIQVSSDAFRPGQSIPAEFTADGPNCSPPLRWTDPPPGTKELAMIVEDPDAPLPEPFVHWVLYKIPPSAGELPGHVPQQAKPHAPAGALQGKNSFGKIGYGGPAPPVGHGTHHYHFRLYALDQPLEVREGLNKDALLAAMSGHVLDEGDLVGTYRR
jgi:Raf kinase inhibitor-like YbhB/YbcL family protein